MFIKTKTLNKILRIYKNKSKNQRRLYSLKKNNLMKILKKKVFKNYLRIVNNCAKIRKFLNYFIYKNNLFKNDFVLQIQIIKYIL